jgi:uncharacterized protein YndB with AHSA1/START domain
MTDLGTLEMRDGETYLRFERRFRHPVEQVWDALVNPDRVALWWAEQKTLEPRAGGTIRMAWTNGGPDVSGVVTVWDPPHRLEHTLDWSEDGSDVRFTWVLSETGDGGTLLEFEHNIVGPEPERKELSGWHTHFVMLDAALDGEPIEFSMDLWREADAKYEAAYPDMELGFIPQEG